MRPPAYVSIRAPVREARTGARPSTRPKPCFDPRPRAGGEVSEYREGRSAVQVSIRAPVREASKAVKVLTSRYAVSIRAPVREARWIRGYNHFHGSVSIRAPVREASRISFRSAPRAGGDTAQGAAVLMTCRFDPRPRAGGDATPTYLVRIHAVSIRAPVRGATGGSQRGTDTCVKFRSAPPCGGATAFAEWIWAKLPVSIRAPVRGATTGAAGTKLAYGVSIRAPVRGATECQLRIGHVVVVSIRAPVRGATRGTAGSFWNDVFRSAPPCGGRRLPADMASRSMPFRSAPPCGGRQDV